MRRNQAGSSKSRLHPDLRLLWLDRGVLGLLLVHLQFFLEIRKPPVTKSWHFLGVLVEIEVGSWPWR
jgi:hypothetical protein